MAAKKLFGTSGIRGLVGSEVTCELALNVGKSLAYYLGNEGTVVLGYDTRTTNDMLDQAICAGLLESQHHWWAMPLKNWMPMQESCLQHPIILQDIME